MLTRPLLLLICTLIVSPVFALSPFCNVTVSAGDVNDVPRSSGFFPEAGPQQNSGVQFVVQSHNVGAVAWNDSKTTQIKVPSCFYLTSGQVLYVRASYVGQIGGPTLTSYCYNERLSTLSATQVYIPTFPGPLWTPCVN